MESDSMSGLNRDSLLDILERAGTSAGEQFLSVVLLVGGASSLAKLPWKYALSTSLGAFAVSVLTTLLVLLTVAGPLPFWADLLIRAVKTFAASLLGSLGTGVIDVLSIPWHTALNIAALATFFAVIKGLVSPNAHLSASWLPTPVIARIHRVEIGPGYKKQEPPSAAV